MKPNYALVVFSDAKEGTDKIFADDNGKLSLEQMQNAVGGYIEILTSLDGKMCLIFDEEGKLKDKPRNNVATFYAQKKFGLVNDYLVGDVILCHADLLN